MLYQNACASVHLVPMGISLPVNPEGVNIINANFDGLTHVLVTLFQEQTCGAGISLSIPAVTSGVDHNAIVLTQSDVSHEIK